MSFGQPTNNPFGRFPLPRSNQLTRKGGPNVHTEDPPFVVPGGTLVALAAIGAVLFIMSSATVKEFAATGITLSIASVLYYWRRRAIRVPEDSQLPT